jgi:hypothetical protein
MRIWKSETVQMVAKTHGYFPASFRWRGRRFDVVGVEKCWTVTGPSVRRMFRVRCQAGLFTLQQTVDGDQWRVSRWPLGLWLLHPVRSTPPRFPLPRHQRRPVAKMRAQHGSPPEAVGKRAGPAAPSQPAMAFARVRRQD